jgi:hypothetical protein
MGEFIYIRYAGPDSGKVLVTMLSEDEATETHEIETETTIKHPVGFMPNPEPEENDEPDEEPGEEDDENPD